jgi:hypothetical protein
MLMGSPSLNQDTADRLFCLTVAQKAADTVTGNTISFSLKTRRYTDYALYIWNLDDIFFEYLAFISRLHRIPLFHVSFKRLTMPAPAA